MLAQIVKAESTDNFDIRFTFKDGTEKTINFKSFIGNSSLTKPLGQIKYFKDVKLYERGRGIYWENGYDFCPDFLRNL
jgi:hypothetical protein